MTATNHALTGAAIGLLVGNPLIAIPLAIASHFICDIIPHFGSQDSSVSWIGSKPFKIYLVIDALICIALVVLLYASHPLHWQTAAVSAFAAASPDFFWIPKFLEARKGRSHKENAFGRFAGRIQWFQRPIGAPVEIAWMIAGIVILLPFVS
jgi:hypothetical protein